MQENHINSLDRISHDAMVVLTPIDEIINTSRSVSEHNFYVICKELRRAKNLMKAIAPKSAIKMKTPPTLNTNNLNKEDSNSSSLFVSSSPTPDKPLCKEESKSE